jgi:hypothetical protein
MNRRSSDSYFCTNTFHHKWSNFLAPSHQERISRKGAGGAKESSQEEEAFKAIAFIFASLRLCANISFLPRL